MLYQYVRSALGLLATGEDKLSQAQQLLLGTLTIGSQRHGDQLLSHAVFGRLSPPSPPGIR